MGSVAPGLAGTKMRGTTVRKRPYYVFWDNDGEGGVRLLPFDDAHMRNKLMAVEEDGAEIEEPYWEAKGMVPLSKLPSDHPAHKMHADICKAAVDRAKADMMPVPSWVPPSFYNPTEAVTGGNPFAAAKARSREILNGG